MVSVQAVPVAIVGMAVLLPGAADLDGYWRTLRAGTDCITEVPAHRWDAGLYDPDADSSRPDRIYCRRGGFVDALADFDPLDFGIMPDSVGGAEPDQLIALQVAARAIADAGGPRRLPERDRIGVILGRGGYLTPGLVRLDQRVRTAGQLLHTLRELMPQLDARQGEAIRRAFTEALGPNRPEAAIGLVPNLAASRIANRLDLRGPAYTVDAACASSLVAVDQAVAELMSGRCDAVLAGGVHHCHDITLWSVFNQLGALSRSGRIRPFHRGADGILIGEGTGVVVLKRLPDARAAGDRVYAVIRGTGVASDGKAASLVNPEPAGQIRAVRAAWAAAGLDPRAADSVGLLEAHGTATPAGDRAELATIAETFGPPGGGTDAGAGAAPVLGSVKSMIGHTMPAAGVAGLVKAALAVHHGVLLPTLHCEDPHPELKNTRFRTLSACEPWPQTSTPRRAGVNAFGFGGINAHVVLEAAPPQPRRHHSTTGTTTGGSTPGTGAAVAEREVRLAAADPDTLARMLDAAEAAPDLDPGSVTGHLVPRGSGRYRLAMVAPTPRAFKLARRVIAQDRPWRGRGDVWFTGRPLLADTDGGRRIAFIFPGLEVGFAPRVEDIAEQLGTEHGTGSVGSHGLGVFLLGRLLEQTLRRIGIQPAAVAGHSVGEWTAMAAAGMFAGGAVDEFIAGFDPDSMRVPGLAFGAIGAGADRVTALLPRYCGIELSHDNAPNQCVVCGPEEPMTRLLAELRHSGVLCQVLPFRSGFHTPMLQPYLDPILTAFEGFDLQPPTVPVWSATTAAPFPNDPEQVRQLFIRHLLEPVRFRHMIDAMHADGIRAFIQVGTGALATLISDILGERDHLAIAANTPNRDGMAQLRRVTAALWAEGFTTGELHGTPEPAPARAGTTIRLDLGTPLISLGDKAATLALAPATAELAQLDNIADQHPVAGQVAQLLRETAASTSAVLAARQQQHNGARRPEPGATPVPTAAPAPSPLREVAGAGVAERRIRLAVDTVSMPYLLDHCFYPQRDDWPDVTDRFPVVPATTVIAHMMDAAGPAAIAVRDARFDQWTAAAPPITVEVTSRPRPDGAVDVEFGRYARAVVETGPAYPAPPAPWPVEAASERAPSIAARVLYEDRWMFHGPLFQGVQELTAIGDRHVRGVIAALPTPGAVLDCVGQLLGYWVMDTLPERTVVFPMGMKHIVFHGPAPAGPVQCHIRIRDVHEATVVADAQLVAAGRVWARIVGWTDRRFGSHPDTRAVEHDPGGALLAQPQPGGWFAVFDRWSDPASQQLRMRGYLGAAEREVFGARPPRGRRQWLLGRIAVKDAVRRAMWDAGAPPKVFPAQISVGNDDAGRPFVAGMHGTVLPPLAVSVAHTGDVGVAIARPGTGTGTGGDVLVGIDVEQVVPRDEATVDFALSEAEKTMLHRLADSGADGGGDGGADVWFARLWTAKEAVGKALGTGLAGDPRRFTVAECTATGAVVTVRGDARRFPVRLYQLANPDDLPARTYIVAVTDNP
ncbi:acyl transferase domain-containing protein/phosphopantetheinyl transferase (holo-ACP synthase) [Catenulispora sp. GP43]|uniref:beta-ketoacyl synthase N-terminal-like domain-containing protein n=1 Tax=Catenulispora sp. GP43 TaxID=3156263 RepID=UPI003519254B